jgi:putative intracellular protease/amidase
MIEKRIVHVAIYDTLADWEVGYATAHLNNPWLQRHEPPLLVRYVGAGGPITTMGGMRVVPDVALADLRPEDSLMLILPGSDIWMGDAFVPFAEKARTFLDAGVPVAAICGSTGGLAIAGLLDDRKHTSNAAEFLAGTGYAGADHYVNEPAVVDGDLVTANSVAPVEFARAILGRLDVYEPGVLDSWFKLFGEKDPAGFYELMAVS